MVAISIAAIVALFILFANTPVGKLAPAAQGMFVGVEQWMGANWVLLTQVALGLAAVALIVALGLRLELRNASFIGLVLGLLIAQIMAAIIAWMHYARLFGMVELTRALKPAPAA